MRSLCFVLLTLVLNGCLGLDPKEKAPDSPLEYVNSDRYAFNGLSNEIRPGDGPLIPIGTLQRVNTDTHISGKAVVTASDQFYQRPAAFVTLVLKTTDAAELTLQTTPTDEHGGFRFALKLDNATYRIVADDPSYVGSQLVKVDGYEVQNVLVTLQRAQTKVIQ